MDSLEVLVEDSLVAMVGTTEEDSLMATSVDMEVDSGGQEAMVVQADQVVREVQEVVQGKDNSITQAPRSTPTSTCSRSRSQTSPSSNTMGKMVV